MAAGSSRIQLFMATALLLCLCTPSRAQLINEFVANHTGTNTHEYVEILGSPSTDYSHLRILQIAGDFEDNPGKIVSVYTPASTNPEGFWVTTFLVGELDNASMSLLLVDTFSGAANDDLDTDDDGVLDSMPWTSLLDSVSVTDNGASDQDYGSPVLAPLFDGITFVPGGASRIPDGQNTGSDSDWVRNDWHGEGLPGFSGSLVVGEAENTPGASNFAPTPRAPVINEVVFDHVGNDDYEFLEIHGEPIVDYSTFSLLEVEGDQGENPGRIDAVYALGLTDIGGFWDTDFLVDTLEDGSHTILLVESFGGAPGDDLDTDDNGVLNVVTPWTTLADSVAFAAPGAVTYSTTVLDSSFDGVGALPGGASRYPSGFDSDLASDWYRNDFDGEGLPIGPGTMAAPEARNTPGTANLLPPVTQYLEVDASSSANLRSTLHEAIDDHVRFPYTSDFTDTWDILEMADEDPGNSSNVLTVYKNESMPKFGGGAGPYNREHSWPKSYGFPDNGDDVYPYSDCFHLFISHVGYNSDRANLKFDTCNAGCTENPTDGGTTDVYPGSSNWRDGSGWETWSERRGNVARAQFYMDVRYEGGTHGVTGASEPDLVLTNNAGLIQTTGGNTSGTAYMGLLDVLVQWHLADPVDDGERLRNEIVSSFQGSRNPFIDHPEWVACLFVPGTCDGLVFEDGFESGNLEAWSSSSP